MRTRALRVSSAIPRLCFSTLLRLYRIQHQERPQQLQWRIVMPGNCPVATRAT